MQAPWSRVAVCPFRRAVLAPCSFFAALLLLVLPYAALAQVHGDGTDVLPIPKRFFHPSKETATTACVADLPTRGCFNSCRDHAHDIGPPGKTRAIGLVLNCPAFEYYFADYFYPVPACEPGETFEPPGTCIAGPGDTGKNNGPAGSGGTCTGVGNPCNPATGNKYQAEADYRSGDGLLSFTRHYNSQFDDDVGLGKGWTSTFHKRLEIDGANVVVRQASGRGEPFTCSGSGPCTGDPDTKLLLDQEATGYTLTLADSATERYDLNGRLIAETDRSGKTTTYGYDANGDLEAVTAPFGHALTLAHANGRLATLTDPNGGVYAYSYDGNGNLTQVTYPDTTVRTYHYEDPAYPNHLTGITDENGDRFATYAYDAEGKAVSTEHAGEQERFTLAYDSDTQTTVTDAIGTQEVMTFDERLGVKRLLSRINQIDSKGLTQIFDANNNLTSTTDAEGRTQTFTHNSNNQRLTMIEAVGTPAARTTTFSYVSDDIDLPTLITSPSVASGQQKQVAIAYDSTNNPRQISQSGFTPGATPVSRTITLQYNALGQVTQIDGPRTVSDITTLAYNNCTSGADCGQLASISNALAHTTTFNAYDAHGRVAQLTDPNGVVTMFTYDPRGRVLTQTLTPPTGPVRITTNSYDLVGQLISTTTSDGITLAYTYDAAHNLIAIQDNLGNKIEYDYDLKGNLIAERTRDPDGILVRNIDTGYDIRNRVASINAAGSLTQMMNDAVGNLTSQIDPKTNPPTTNTYDPLDRLSQTVDAISGITSYGYDVNDQLIQVTAPNSANTQYVYDDLDNLLQESSPDRGTLAFSYDDAGNVTRQTDARGVTVDHSYDALNRLTFIDYPGTEEDVTFTYDSCANGIGRLCITQDESGTTTLAYDAFGNVTQHDKTELGVTYTTQYTYDLDDRITSITYPDGSVATYTRDVLGRITDVSMTVNGVATNLVNTLTYRADGLLTGQTFGNGIAETRDYDLQGRLLTQTTGTVDTRIYTYDANGNVTAFAGNAASASYGYDALDRLTQDTGSPRTSSFSYDANGNRLSAGNQVYVYAPASNRLVSDRNIPVQMDPAGNVIAYFSDRSREATNTYNQAGRLATQVMHDRILCPTIVGRPCPTDPVTKLLGTYTYNAFGQRTRKVSAAGTTVFHYDTAGRVIAETREDGDLIRTYLWRDDRPIAQIEAGETVHYLHTDYLGVPRLATNAAATVIWHWEGAAFGDTLPNLDPDGDQQATTINLRFPGQYYDIETGLFYNWHRYYSPGLGRYMTSDPIGLDGGPNTYTYVDNNVLRWVDIRGLAKKPPNPKNTSSKELTRYAKQCGYVCTQGAEHTVCKKPGSPSVAIPRHGKNVNSNTARSIIKTISENCNDDARDCPPETAPNKSEDTSSKKGINFGPGLVFPGLPGKGKGRCPVPGFCPPAFIF